ncbi:MAG: DNA repair protein RecO [Betaproteobacteria bacterium]|jgi:DNA repair protein RecO (recombination protein O)|nr:DNA repair protein RecO [Betaproteobacteria bacterium]
MALISHNRRDDEPAYLLHTYPYRETSLIAEVYSRHAGRVAIIARGARRPRAALRGVLMAFQPLLLSWSGKAELKTLHKAEWRGGYKPLRGMSLICGFYLNELMLKLLPREDAHEYLFDAYADALQRLAEEADHAAVLRRFERILLQELGYGLVLDREAGGGAAIRGDALYRYLPDRGPLPVMADDAGSGVELHGQTLIDMASDSYADPRTLQQSKLLMRALINHCLGDQILHTRQLLRDLQQL